MEERDAVVREASLVEERKVYNGIGRAVTLCCPPLSAAAFAADRFGKIGGAGAEEQERADQEVHGHGGVAGFHLRHPGLAGLKALSQLNL